MKNLKIVLIISLFIYLPIQSGAWSLLGHRIVGEIAESYLTPQAKKTIMEILGNESMAITSNWPDFIKSDPAYKYLDSWHYINFDDGFTEQSMNAYLKQDTATDAYTKINFLVKELKNKQLPKDKKLLYLRLLIHIVGDVHQPLHTGRLSDLGGNKVKVLWFNEPTNLHSVWDEKLIDEQKLSYTEYTKNINHTTAAQRAAWQKAHVSEWLFESYSISHKIYDEIKQPDQKLSYRYNFDHIQTVNEQLLKGGVRLAGLLNAIFSNS